MHVITREGYFAGQPTVSEVALARKAKQPADIKYDLLSAARTTMVYTGLHMQAQRTKVGYTLAGKRERPEVQRAGGRNPPRPKSP